MKARSLAYLYAAGAVLGLLTLVLPHDEQVRDLPLWILGGTAIVVGAVVWARAARISEWQLHALVALGSVILTLANYWVGETGLYPIIYSWIALYAFYFFGLRVALAHVATIALA